MATMETKIRHGFDSLLELESGDTANTTVGNNPSEVVFDLQALVEAYWDNNELGTAEEFAIQLIITACDAGSGDETYRFDVQVDSVSDFSDTPVTVVFYTHTRGVLGEFEILVAREHIEALDADAAFLRLNVVAGGTTPSITYQAFVAPVQN
jgi:hypothetical protein